MSFNILVGILLILVIAVVLTNKQSSFNTVLSGAPITDKQPNSFPVLGSDAPVNNSPLKPPEVKEEIGLGMNYVQGQGGAMDRNDSDAYGNAKRGELLTNYSIPESYGESSLTDPSGIRGANEGARIIKLTNPGKQSNYKPVDEIRKINYASAYSTTEENPENLFLDKKDFIDYNDTFKPESGLIAQSSPGQMSSFDKCETTYPNTQKYESFCITDGDIPYGKVVNGKVNPRLVSRWESYTGEYSPQSVLDQTNGLLYPTLNNNFPAGGAV